MGLIPQPYTDDHILAELVCARTQDGVLHSGAFFRPERQSRPVVAVLWVHGAARNFYYPSYLRIGSAVAARGHAFASGNTRGHDVGAVIRWDEALNRPVLGGAAWERFDEGALDIAAWIDRLSDLGYSRVVLVGHSMGGWRVAHYQATQADARVRGLVIASTPLLPPDPLLRHPPELLDLAQRMIIDGRDDDLLPPERLGHHQSAASVLRLRELDLDLYGMRSGKALLGHVACPVLAWFGTAADEASIGSVADLERARRAIPASVPFEIQEIEGANHMYNGHEEEVARVLAEWVSGLEDVDQGDI